MAGKRFLGKSQVDSADTLWIKNFVEIILTRSVSEINTFLQILLKIFDIYSRHYLATNKKIAITHLWHAIECQTICHLTVKYKVAEQRILGKYCNCNSFGVTMDLLTSQNFKVAITQLLLYYVIAYQKLDNIFEKNSLILILLKIFDIYLCHYFATNKKIAITHLWHAIEPQTMYHLIGK